jgi:hypothetical protein
VLLSCFSSLLRHCRIKIDDRLSYLEIPSVILRGE